MTKKRANATLCRDQEVGVWCTLEGHTHRQNPGYKWVAAEVGWVGVAFRGFDRKADADEYCRKRNRERKEVRDGGSSTS